MTTSNRRQTTSKHFITMLKIAEELGCQLSPTPASPSILRGLCPFHDADTVANADTLMVNTTTTRFWCIRCPAQGNPTAFAAKAWLVSARDARTLMEANPTAGADRPLYKPQPTEDNREQARPQPQNTAILTRAAHFYAAQLYKYFEPMHFLARLGIHPREAAKSGIGYCPGEGLKDYLLENGISETEVLQSSLFQEHTGMELFNGRMTLADQDYTGGTMWITSFPPDAPTDNYRWKQSPRPTMGLPGQKPYLFNLGKIEQRAEATVLTDDQRLYIALRGKEHPCILVTQKRRDRLELETHVRRITNALGTKELKSINIAMHDRALRERIQEALQGSEKPPKAVATKSRNEIIDYLNLGTRSLDILTETESDASPKDQPEAEKPP